MRRENPAGKNREENRRTDDMSAFAFPDQPSFFRQVHPPADLQEMLQVTRALYDAKH